jgi:adenylyltransferase/sulfurtransferase
LINPPEPSPSRTARHSRQESLPGMGPAAQQRLRDAHAVIVGCGALGCQAADLLCRAGVGRMTILDRDVVELTNLQRQCLFTTADAEAGLPKAEAARRRLAAIDPAVRTEGVVADVHSGNAEELCLRGPLGQPTILVDGADNYETRFLLNDLAVKHALPYAYAGVVGWGGMAALFTPADPARPSPCLRCLFESPPPAGSQPTCESAGVFGPAVAIVAGAQAAEALRHLAGLPVAPTLLEFDLHEPRRRRVDLAAARDPDCPCCGRRRFEFLDAPPPSSATLCGQNAVQLPAPPAGAAALPVIAERLRAHGPVNESPFLVRASVEPGRTITVFRDGRAIVAGVASAEQARAVYARFVGS